MFVFIVFLAPLPLGEGWGCFLERLGAKKYIVTPSEGSVDGWLKQRMLFASLLRAI